MISALASVSMFTFAANTLELLTASDTLSDAGRTMIAEALESLDAGDPCGIRYAVYNEPRLVIPGTRAQLRDKGRPAEGAARELRKEAAVNQAAVEKWITGYERWAQDVQEAWDAEDWVARWAEIERKMAAMEYGLLCGMLAPALEMPHKYYVETRESLVKLKADLKASKPLPSPTGSTR